MGHDWEITTAVWEGHGSFLNFEVEALSQVHKELSVWCVDQHWYFESIWSNGGEIGEKWEFVVFDGVRLNGAQGGWYVTVIYELPSDRELDKKRSLRMRLISRWSEAALMKGCLSRSWADGLLSGSKVRHCEMKS